MALKVPVAATRAGGISDLIEDRVSGLLVPPRDPVHLADALEELVREPEKRNIYVEAAFEMDKSFDISQTVLKTEAVYREVLGEGE